MLLLVEGEKKQQHIITVKMYLYHKTPLIIKATKAPPALERLRLITIKRYGKAAFKRRTTCGARFGCRDRAIVKMAGSVLVSDTLGNTGQHLRMKAPSIACNLFSKLQFYAST